MIITDYRVIYLLMKYRSRIEIFVLILEAAIGGATRTTIIHKSFLSYALSKEYLIMLIENALLEYEDGTQKYRTTKKGENLAKKYRKLEEEFSGGKIPSATEPPKYKKRNTNLLILEAAKGGSTRTKIMFKSFMDFPDLKKYLTGLIEKGLLSYDDEKEKYTTTEKGLRLLKIVNQIEDLIPRTINTSNKDIF